MEEFYSPVWQEYLGGVSGIVFTIIIILLFAEFNLQMQQNSD